MRPLKNNFLTHCSVCWSFQYINSWIIKAWFDLTKGVRLIVLEASITGSFTPNSITRRIVHTLHKLLEIILWWSCSTEQGSLHVLFNTIQGHNITKHVSLARKHPHNIPPCQYAMRLLTVEWFGPSHREINCYFIFFLLSIVKRKLQNPLSLEKSPKSRTKKYTVYDCIGISLPVMHIVIQLFSY